MLILKEGAMDSLLTSQWKTEPSAVPRLSSSYTSGNRFKLIDKGLARRKTRERGGNPHKVPNVEYLEIAESSTHLHFITGQESIG